MDIGDPLALVKLPRPQTENGHILFGQVCSLTNGTKRKRQEICAAIDGDSLNIYEVHNGRNLSSYSVPPDCKFSCPPCSIRRQDQANKKIRTTYYITQSKKQARLSVFEEQSDSDIQKPLSKSISLENSTDPPVHLDILPVLKTHQVLMTTENGHFMIYEAGLSSLVRQGVLRGCTEGACLVAAQWLSTAQASRTVLKARPDISATSDPGSTFVVGVFSTTNSSSDHTSSNGLEYGVWRLAAAGSNFSTESLLEPIIHHRFALSSQILSRECDPVKFSLKDTTIVVKTQSMTYMLNLTSTIPKTLKEINPAIPEQLSSITISDGLLLCSTPATLQLHNTNFRTVQAKLELNKTGLKRKRTRDSEGLIHFVAYFSTLNRVIAMRRDLLVAIDMHVTDVDGFAAAIRQSALLVNNIGRGSTPYERSKSQDQTTAPNEQWQSTLKQLEKAIQDKDLAKFESVGLSIVSAGHESLRDKSQTLTNDKVDYLISKIFEFHTISDASSKATNRKLKIVFVAPKLLEWLIVNGLLSVERINRALRSNTRSTYETISHGDISQILMDSDDSLDILHSYLLNAPYLTHQELCNAVQLLLRRALQKPAATSPLAITAVQNTDSIKPGFANDILAVTETDEGIPANVTSNLCIAIERLAQAEQIQLSSYLRRTFTQREIIALVQFLRQQLFRSGYTRSIQAQPYASPLSSEGDTSAEDKSRTHEALLITLPAIVSTLSICMDAMGPIGMLSFGEDEQFVQKLIPELSSEIARATEAVQDATFLEGMLRETLRFIESTTQSQAQVHDQEDVQNAQRSKPGAIVTLYSEPVIEGNGDTATKSLPLGLRAEGKINTIKVRKGDGRTSKRSAREMGMLQDRLRGPYALERLIL